MTCESAPVVFPSSHDFRSDTCTTPSPELLAQCQKASIGDLAMNEDADTLALEKHVASLMGMEAGLFCVSGTLSNQLAVRTHLLQPPTSVLCDYQAHIYCHESAGLAILSQTMVSPVIPSNGVYLTLEDIQKHYIPDDGDIHGAPTKLVSLENTLHGMLFPFEELTRISQWCRSIGVPLHCDGARLWNAHAETGIPLSEYGKLFDSVSLCMSKSLGAPIGSVLVGTRKFIRKAEHFRKQQGGGIRQAGFITRLCSITLEENLPKLKTVNTMAKRFAQYVQSKGWVLRHPCHTNFVFVDMEQSKVNGEVLREFAAKRGVALFRGGRFAFHYQQTEEAFVSLCAAVDDAVEYYKNNKYVAGSFGMY